MCPVAVARPWHTACREQSLPRSGGRAPAGGLQEHSGSSPRRRRGEQPLLMTSPVLTRVERWLPGPAQPTAAPLWPPHRRLGRKRSWEALLGTRAGAVGASGATSPWDAVRPTVSRPWGQLGCTELGLVRPCPPRGTPRGEQVSGAGPRAENWRRGLCSVGSRNLGSPPSHARSTKSLDTEPRRDP